MSVTFLQPWFLLALIGLLVLIRIWKKGTLAPTAGSKSVSFLVLRGVTLLLVILALSDPRLLFPSDRVNLFFLLDMSESVSPEGRDSALNYLRQSLTGMGKEDRAGLILFGKGAHVESELKNPFSLSDLKSQIDGQATDIRGALQLAAGLFPSSGQHRIVLMSDGNENRNHAMEGAYLAKSLGVKIFPLPLPTWFQGEEVFIETLETPDQIGPQTPFDVRIGLKSTFPGAGELLLFKNGRLLFGERIHFEPGKELYRFQDEIGKPGITRYEVRLHPDRDGIPQNNRGLSFTRSVPRPAILYLTASRATPSPFKEALEQQGLRVIVKDPAEITESLFDLLDYQAVVLHDLSSRHFSPNVLENLERYVRDLGGGLLMIGGPNGFGAGGYLHTPVEKALPVFMDVPTTVELAGLALVLVIDKSSSMAGDLEKKNKMEGAKIAAYGALEMIGPLDRAGILLFDTEHQWLLPMAPVSDRKKVAALLSGVKESGGTDLFPALEEAFRVLKETPAARKHIIILSDGLTRKGDFAALTDAMREAKITVSTVALGKDADRVLLKEIARRGGGRSYFTEDVEKIPRIFVGETRMAAQKVVVEKILQPEVITDVEPIRGLPLKEIPRIEGQVVTYPKKGALHLLRTAEGPLLSVWQYGLGRSAAFTSDLGPRWGKSWIVWPHYGAFAAQLVKWVKRQEPSAWLRLEWKRKEGRTSFRFEADDERGNPLNFIEWEGGLLSPSGKKEALKIEQTAPGTYEGSFASEEAGEYFLTIYPSSKAGKASGPILLGYGVPYSDEFLQTGIHRELLVSLAEISGGRLLDLHQSPQGLFQAEGQGAEMGSPLWPWLTLAAMVLMTVEIAWRKWKEWG